MGGEWLDYRTPDEQSAEEALGVRLPIEYLSLLRAMGGFEGWVGPADDHAYLVVHSLDEVLSLERVSNMTARFEGTFAFGGSGSRLVYLLDCRESPAPVWMTDITGSNWDDADRQAPDIGTFIAQLMAKGREALNFGY